MLGVACLSPVVLVGQAPGRVEQDVRRPFSGRSGAQLFGWLERAGLGGEAQARQRVYMTAVTKCFPGAAGSGSGDRRPSPAEIELCRPFLDRQLELLRPRLVLAVGQLAIERFLGRLNRRPMAQLVGRQFLESGEEHLGPLPGQLVVAPLPHPSGASRWLNDSANRELLNQALDRVRAAVGELELALTWRR